ncbi:hypothetical protein [Streptomyces sp. NBC_00019]|uniref:hypothetical protein n=1 Tax=Streptomyces sp. NBC_00019 TaxID=2975623 RepID=UPI00324D8B41
MNGALIRWSLSCPSPEGWDYGDECYGIEPLALPWPGDSWAIGPAETAEVTDMWEELLRYRPLDARTADPEPETLYWFRWITGHQMSFILWRLMSDVLEGRRDGHIDRDMAAEQLTLLVRAYAAMLEYTSRLPVDVYASVIRPSLRRLHPAFSGTWAPDYAPVRMLLTGRHAEFRTGTTRLRHAIVQMQKTHIQVARKLVPGGASLLAEARNSWSMRQHPRQWGSVFDCAFLTVRTPLPRADMISQMARRAKAILIDVDTNDLDEPGPYDAAIPAGRRDKDMPEQDGTISELVLETTTWALSRTRPVMGGAL